MKDLDRIIGHSGAICEVTPFLVETGLLDGSIARTFNSKQWIKGPKLDGFFEKTLTRIRADHGTTLMIVGMTSGMSALIRVLEHPSRLDGTDAQTLQRLRTKAKTPTIRTVTLRATPGADMVVIDESMPPRPTADAVHAMMLRYGAKVLLLERNLLLGARNPRLHSLESSNRRKSLRRVLDTYDSVPTVRIWGWVEEISHALSSYDKAIRDYSLLSPFSSALGLVKGVKDVTH